MLSCGIKAASLNRFAGSAAAAHETATCVLRELFYDSASGQVSHEATTFRRQRTVLWRRTSSEKEAYILLAGVPVITLYWAKVTFVGVV